MLVVTVVRPRAHMVTLLVRVGFLIDVRVLASPVGPVWAGVLEPHSLGEGGACGKQQPLTMLMHACK